MTLKDDILSLYASGKTYKQIKKQLNCSLGTISYYCAPGQKEKTMQRQRDRRSKARKFIQEYKQGKPCTDCGEVYPYYVMQFDHLDDKLFGISNSGFSLDAILKEIEKCELVCANCHAFRSHNRLVKHGGDTLEFDMEGQLSGR